MASIELWFFMVTDPLTGQRRRTTYRLTEEQARHRYVDPEAVPGSLEVREVQPGSPGHGSTIGGEKPSG